MSAADQTQTKLLTGYRPYIKRYSFPHVRCSFHWIKSVSHLDQVARETRVAISNLRMWMRTIAGAVRQLSAVDLDLLSPASEEAEIMSPSLKAPFFYEFGGL